MDRIIYNKYSNERDHRFNIRTEITVDEQGARKVRKYATCRESIPHVRRMYDMYQRFQKQYEGSGVEVCPCILEGDAACFAYRKGHNLKELMTEAVARNEQSEFYRMFDRFTAFARAQGQTVSEGNVEQFREIFGMTHPAGWDSLQVHCPVNLDLNFDNVVVDGDLWTVLDYEWSFDMAVPVEFLLYRSVFYLLYRSPYRTELEAMNLYERAGVPAEYMDCFAQMEQAFQRYVVGDAREVKQYGNRGIDVKKLIVQRVWEAREISFQVYEDVGAGIREEDSRRIVVELDADDRFCFSYTPDAKASKLRIDPGDKPILLHLDEADTLRQKQTNGCWLDEQTIYFPEADPWFELERPEKEITICGRAGKSDEIVWGTLKGFLQENERQKGLLSVQADQLNVQAEQLSAQKEQLKDQEQLKQQMNAILTSTSWRVTAWLRRISGVLRREPRIDRERPGIAVHLHLFYTDLLDEFLGYFANIPYPFDLYVSCVKGADKGVIRQSAKERLPMLRRAAVHICENRGRDIAPFYVEFGKELVQYQYVLHVHSKKSKHIEAGGAEWRKYSLDSLLGTKERTGNILRRFMEEPDVGLIYPDWHPDIPTIGYTWMGNGAGGRELLERMGIPYREGLFFYPTGSFFWARVDAIRPLFEQGFTNKDFPSEQGQIDGTLAHALERVIAFVVKSRGYHSYMIDVAEHAMRRDRTMKPFREYLAKTKESALQELMQYETISFGVFGTLIDFLPYREEDIVELVRKRLGLDEVFVTLRREAERRARARCGSAMTIDEIYAELITISPFDDGAAAQLKQAELDCIGVHVKPRIQMREIYRELIQAGKQVVVVCDTYYHKDTIEALLVKCGYIGYHKIWVSCDHGVSKRDEQMWNLVYAECDPAHHIHVGCDAYADWYTLERRGTRSMYVMSARQAYELSAVYEEPSPSMTLQDSLDLGQKVKQELFPSPFGLAGQKEMC